MAAGTIKNLVADRGFGFLAPEEPPADGRDLVFHRSDVQAPMYFHQLQTGQRVAYDLGRDARRGTPKATNVRTAAD